MSISDPPSLRQLKQAIPKKCFEKNTLRSISFLVRDFVLCIGLWLLYPLFESMLPWYTGVFLYWQLGGLFMWCLFVVGHDCGHTTFSNSQLVNDLVGHLSHSVLLVPFWPWARSHHKHHSYHQHIGKDVSHPWLSQQKFDSKNAVQQFFLTYLAPFIAFPLYLLGVQGSPKSAHDGTHFLPRNLYFGASLKAKLQCIVSSICVIATGLFIYSLHANFTEFALRYGGCWLVMCWWLFAVTYMQHHDIDDTRAYDGDSWSFLKGALQTVDRRFGFGIDYLHHHITDGHVVHHLFFTQVPHYHLKEATVAVRKQLGKHYKFVPHSSRGEFFVSAFWKLFLKIGYLGWKLD